MSAVLNNDSLFYSSAKLAYSKIWVTLLAGNGNVLLDYEIKRDVEYLTREACVYDVLRFPDGSGIKCAGDLIEPLHKALSWMERMKQRSEESINLSGGLKTDDQILDYIALYDGMLAIALASAANPEAMVC